MLLRLEPEPGAAEGGRDDNYGQEAGEESPLDGVDGEVQEAEAEEAKKIKDRLLPPVAA